LSRHSQHRKLMFRNLLVSLVDHERIRTTMAKAKELRSLADKLVTLGKKGSLHARRQAFGVLRNESTVKKLFTEIAPRFKERTGGYTRIFKLGWRPGDNAPLSLIEWVTAVAEETKKKSTVTKAKEAIKKMAPKGKEKGAGAKKERGTTEAKGKKAQEAKKTTKPKKAAKPAQKEKTQAKEEKE
jgi:large subunit ribosomal protein L17